MEKIKVSIIGTDDTTGGAARSTYRLHQGLLGISVDSKFYALNKKGDDVTVLKQNSTFQKLIGMIRPYIDLLFLKLYKKRSRGTAFTTAMVPSSRWLRTTAFKADIVNFHWVAGGYVSIESLASIKRPVVWTLHDSWVFTGGCHVPQDCKRYTDECGQCPQLGSKSNLDLSRIIYKRKNYYWAKSNITLVTPSRWLADCARKSSLFKDHHIEVIPNGIDTNIFKVLDKKECRKILNLPEEGKIILFGAVGGTSDLNKGFQFIQPTLKELSNKTNFKNTKLLIFGASKPEHPPEMGFETFYIGRLNDDVSLNVLYSAADVILVPSMQENLPNVVMESMASGTPVVAFDIGGIPDMVEHKVNGYLARPYDCADMAKGIQWMLEGEQQKNLSKLCRDKITENFDLTIVARKYEQLFRSLLLRDN